MVIHGDSITQYQGLHDSYIYKILMFVQLWSLHNSDIYKILVFKKINLWLTARKVATPVN